MEKREISDTLKACLPDRVSAYLFDGGLVRERLPDLSPLRNLISGSLEDLRGYV